MKKISIIILFILFNSCGESFLDRNPQGVVFNENLANPDGIEGLLIGAYGSLHGNVIWYAGSPGSNWLFGSVFADDAYVGSTLDDQPPMNDIERYHLHSANYNYGDRWGTLYDGIARCNHTIHIVNLALESQNITETAAIQYKAEALFSITPTLHCSITPFLEMKGRCCENSPLLNRINMYINCCP